MKRRGRPFKDKAMLKQIRVSQRLYHHLLAMKDPKSEPVGVTLERLFFSATSQNTLAVQKQLDSLSDMLKNVSK